MKVVVRPPTKRTRRKQININMGLPEPIFMDLMSPLETGDADAFEWTDEKKTALKPTKETTGLLKYEYTIKKPAVVSKLWRLETREAAPKAQRRGGRSAAVRRGLGAARLHLSGAKEERGELTDLLAHVTGNVIIRFTVPKKEKAMPTLKMTLAVSTLNESGNIIWANNYYAARTAAALRKQMCHYLEKMIDDPEYPTLTRMAPALTMGMDQVRPDAEEQSAPVAGLLR